MAIRKSVVIPIVTLFMFFSTLNSVLAVEFHVSPVGNDANPGSLARPFATLEKARDAARAAADDADIIIFLHDGIYRLARTLELDSRDSGRKGYKLVYAALPGASPILSGARSLTGWKPTDPLKVYGLKIFRSQGGKEPFRQLFVDGTWAQRARTPNFKIAASSRRQGVLMLHAANWPKAFGETLPRGLQLAVCVHWRHLSLPIISTRRVDKRIILVLPEKEKLRPVYPPEPASGDTCHLENALALLDRPGEWFHDPVTGTVYFMPEAGADLSRTRIESPVLSTLIRIKGTRTKPVRDLEFRGITLEGTAWAPPPQIGVYFTQFAQPYDVGIRPMTAALIAANTERFAFRDGAVRCAGGNGIHLKNALDADIAGNQFRDIGCNGLVGIGAIFGIAIWNNDFSRCGRDISNGGGILLSNPTRGALIEHNHIHDMPYSGLQVGNQASGRDVGTHNNKIRFNHVHHCMQLHDDGGGIYTLGGQQRGSEIAYNFVHDIKRNNWANIWPVDGIYLDNETQFIHIHDNVVRNCTRLVMQENGSRNNRLERNVYACKSIEMHAGIKPGFEPRRN